jgi:spore germination cell wall hydrolase CwlJ-like protein
MTKKECIIILLISVVIAVAYYLRDANVNAYAASKNVISDTVVLVPIKDIEQNQNTGAPVIELPEQIIEEEKPTAYYSLTDEERNLVESVVMAEAGGEDYDGQRLVAQCILNACILEEKRPDEIVIDYQYTKNRPEPSESVKQAVAAVFVNYDVVTEENILVFYAPRWCTSEWHESQQFVLEHGGHRFFAFNS